jgi:Sec-independent protein translocase protein TatA
LEGVELRRDWMRLEGNFRKGWEDVNDDNDDEEEEEEEEEVKEDPRSIMKEVWKTEVDVVELNEPAVAGLEQFKKDVEDMVSGERAVMGMSNLL